MERRSTATLGVMTNTRVLLICSGAFIAGVAVGGGAIWAMTERATAQAIANDAAAGVGGKVLVLKSLRDGDAPKASEMLESMLDSDLVTLGLVPEATINPPMVRAIARAADYRSGHPYNSGDPVVDSAVSDILSKYRVARSLGK